MNFSKVDSYLYHLFKNKREASKKPNKRIKARHPILLPMLIKLSSANWLPKDVPDLRIITKMGNIIACTGSLDTVISLENDPNVISIESSR